MNSMQYKRVEHLRELKEDSHILQGYDVDL